MKNHGAVSAKCIWRIGVIAIALFAATIHSSSARAGGYERRWEGMVAEGGSNYFVPVDVAAADFDGDRHDEALVVDADGVCHLLGWDGWSLDEVWITSFSVDEGRVRQIVPAALEGGIIRQAVILAADGSLVVLRHDKVGFRKVCSDCMAHADRDRFQVLRIAAAPVDSEYRDGLVAVARSHNDLFLLLLRWAKGQFNVISANPFDPGMSPMGIFPARTDRGPVSSFYAYGTGGGRQTLLARIGSDEEGMSVNRVWPVAREGFRMKFMTPVDLGGSGRPGLLFVGTGKEKAPDAKGKPAAAPSVVEASFFQPGRSAPDESFAVALPGAAFAVAADLNGDGSVELLFGNYEARFEVDARTRKEIDVDGRRTPIAGHLRKQGRTIYADATVLGGGKVEARAGVVRLSNAAGEFLFDVAAKKVTMRPPEDEEFTPARLPFAWKDKVLYLEIASAAKVLGFTWDWDELSAALTVHMEQKEGKSTWSRTH